MDNSCVWADIYDTTDFGNRWASSYLVSLFHGRIKPMLAERMGSMAISDMNVLDFGCSLGANAQIFKALGMNVYGIDVSSKAIQKCIGSGLGDDGHFKAANILKETEKLRDVFKETQFEFILASECMYYFTNSERRNILEQFYGMMPELGILYVSTPTYDYTSYREYKKFGKDKDGMVKVKETGSVHQELRVNLPRNRKDMEEMFLPFHTVDILTTNMQIVSGSDEIEYHLLAEKMC